MICNSFSMTPALEKSLKLQVPWSNLVWVCLILVACYAPVLKALVGSWDDPDMGHGYFVPLAAGFIVWQQREELLSIKPKPNWWGLSGRDHGWGAVDRRHPGRGVVSHAHRLRDYVDRRGLAAGRQPDAERSWHSRCFCCASWCRSRRDLSTSITFNCRFWPASWRSGRWM